MHGVSLCVAVHVSLCAVCRCVSLCVLNLLPPVSTDEFRAPNFGATLEGKPRVLYDTSARLFKLWYDFPSCPGVDGAYSDTLYRQST